MPNQTQSNQNSKPEPTKTQTSPQLKLRKKLKIMLWSVFGIAALSVMAVALIQIMPLKVGEIQEKQFTTGQAGEEYTQFSTTEYQKHNFAQDLATFTLENVEQIYSFNAVRLPLMQRQGRAYSEVIDTQLPGYTESGLYKLGFHTRNINPSFNRVYLAIRGSDTEFTPDNTTNTWYRMEVPSENTFHSLVMPTSVMQWRYVQYYFELNKNLITSAVVGNPVAQILTKNVTGGEISQCTIGEITSTCTCGSVNYTDGYCCTDGYNNNLWFDPTYGEYGGCPDGNFRYVSNSGNNSNPGTYAQPWATMEYGAKQLNENDTMIVRGGTYPVVGNDEWSPTISPVFERDGTATNPIVIKAYPGEDAFIQGPSCPTNTNIGSDHNNYLFIDGFRIEGLIKMQDASHVVVINNDMSKGGDDDDGFRALIYPSRTHNVLIKNNKLHDNCPPGTGGGGQQNKSLIVEYTSWDTIIEHNEIYNSQSAGINLKDGAYSPIVRYNYIHNNADAGVWTANQPGAFNNEIPGYNVRIHNNILSNNVRSVEQVLCNLNIHIYNNLMLDPVSVYSEEAGNTSCPNYYAHIWNNILIPTSFNYHYLNYNNPPETPASKNFISFSDYNNFFGAQAWDYRGTSANSLSGWKSVTDWDDHSLNTNPGFIDEFYHLPENSPLRIAGQDRQDYDNDGNITESIPMGPYITGDENIGVTNYLVE